MRSHGRLADLKHEAVVITGYLSVVREAVERRIRASGGWPQDKVTGSTTILVQGRPNPLYAYERPTGTRYGNKLAEVDRRRSAGQSIAVITEPELAALLSGRGLTRLQTIAADYSMTSKLGVRHRDGRRAGIRETVFVSYDPGDADRASERHHRTLDQLAAAVRASGAEPLDPIRPDAAYDLLWRRNRTTWLAEVKTITSRNAARQVRHAIGQLFHYAAALDLEGPLRMALVTDEPVRDEFLVAACRRAHIDVVWVRRLRSIGL